MVRTIAERMDALASRMDEAGSGGVVKTGLRKCYGEMIMRTTTEGLYGPHNPFRDQKVCDTFW